MNVNNVEKSFSMKNHSRATKILTQGWNPMNVKNVGTPWHADQFLNRCGNTLEIYLLNVRNVRKHSLIPILLQCIKAVTMEGNPINVNSMEKHLKLLNLLEYMEEFTEVRKHYECNLCGKAFNYFSAFQSHKRFHTGETPYACKKCSQVLSSVCLLKNRERIHTGEKPFTCNKLGKTLGKHESLKKHYLLLSRFALHRLACVCQHGTPHAVITRGTSLVAVIGASAASFRTVPPVLKRRNQSPDSRA